MQKAIKKDISSLDLSTMSPRALEKIASKGHAQSIDDNLFVEAITLCALYSDTNK